MEMTIDKLSNSPIVPITKEGIFSAAECQAILDEVAGEEFKSGTVAGLGEVTDKRHSSVFWLSDVDRFKAVYQKVSSVLQGAINSFGFECSGFGAIQIARYKVGEYYDWHLDIGVQKGTTSRKVSLAVLLSDPDSYGGGDLEFDDYIVKDRMKQGTCIAFPSYLRHRVAPVEYGVRYSMVAWAMGPAFK